MKDPLELRVLQSGFAGITGTLYRIEPSGEFVVKTLINDKEQDTVNSGTLDLAAMMAIQQELQEANIDRLPQKTEIYDGVNPSILDLRYGGVARVITLAPGKIDFAACEPASAGATCGVFRLSDTIVKTVERATR